MSAWEVLAKSMDFFVWSAVAVALAIMGRAAKLFHEEARGEQKVTWSVILRNIPDALVVGVGAVCLIGAASAFFTVPFYVGVGLGGTFGYLGLQTLAPLVTNAMQRFIQKKTPDGPNS